MGLVGNNLEPVTARASLWFAFIKPEPFDVGNFIRSEPTNHPVRVISVNNVGLLYGALPPSVHHFQLS